MQDSPGKAQQKKSQQPTSREERLKAALKANMARRKAQARARQDAAGDDDSETGKE
jgi:hypothetical protein